MKCVILAAGEGKRLKPQNGSPPKPLRRILGMPLIERVLLTLSEAGINQFLVVTGYKSSEIEEFLGDGSRYGLSIEYHHNPKWFEGNGSSLCVVQNRFAWDERFFVTMSDHIIQPEAVKRFVDYVNDNEGLFLLTDTRRDYIRDMVDATKVDVLLDGTIKAIDKKLKRYSKTDCGFFCLDSDIYKALGEVFKDGKYRLSDGVDHLVNRFGRKIQTVDIGDFYWQDIDEYEDIPFTEKKMLSALATHKDGIVSRYLNRRISIQITKYLSRFSISPNQVSVAAFFLGIFSGLLFFLSKPLFAGLLAQGSSVLDGVDGEVARLKHANSAVGGLVDSLLDRYVDTIILASLSYYAYLRTGSIWVLVLGAMTLAASPLSMALKDKFSLLLECPYEPGRMDGIIKFLLPNRDGRLFLVMIGGLLPQLLFPVLLLLALGSNLQIATRVLFIKRRLRKEREIRLEIGRRELVQEVPNSLQK